MHIVYLLISIVSIECINIHRRDVYVGNDVGFKFNRNNYLTINRTTNATSRFEIRNSTDLILKNINPSDNGSYEIYINRRFTDLIILNVLNGTCNGELYFDILSGTHVLTCWLSPNMLNLTWMLDGFNLNASIGIRIVSNIDRVINKNIKIHKMIIFVDNFDTDYDFKLIGSVENTSYILNSVNIRTTNKIVTAMIGDNITLYCVSDSDYWMKLSSTFKWLNASTDGGKLILTNLSVNDAGNYICRTDSLASIIYLTILNNTRNPLELTEVNDEFSLSVSNEIRPVRTNLLRLKRISHLQYDIGNSVSKNFIDFKLIIIIILLIII